jgi:hypothetical protein
MTEAEKEKFIDNYGDRVQSGLRQTMKIILNSLRGKFGQRVQPSRGHHFTFDHTKVFEPVQLVK